jgi:hypothetical protein
MPSTANLLAPASPVDTSKGLKGDAPRLIESSIAGWWIRLRSKVAGG